MTMRIYRADGKWWLNPGGSVRYYFDVWETAVEGLHVLLRNIVLALPPLTKVIQ